MSSTDAPRTSPEDPAPPPPARPIAQLRAKKLTEKEKEELKKEQERLKAESDTHARNVARLGNEIAFLSAQLKKERGQHYETQQALKEERANCVVLKEDVKEEQVTKQATINDLKKTLEKEQRIVAEQDERLEVYRGQHLDLVRRLEASMMAERESEKRIETLEAEVKELHEKNGSLEKDKEAVESNNKTLEDRNKTLEKHIADATNMAKKPDSQVEELQDTIRTLQRRKESLDADIEHLRGELETAEQKATDASTSYRQAQTTIDNNEATIKKLQHLVQVNEKEIKRLKQEIGDRDGRIRSKEDDVRHKEAEIATLSNINTTLLEENKSIKARSDRLEAQALAGRNEIEVLQVASRHSEELEKALAGAQAAEAELKRDIIALEQTNIELKNKLEEYLPLNQGVSNTGSNLETELSESGYGTLMAGDEASTVFTAPDDVTESHEISTTPETTTPEVVVTSPNTPQAPAVTNSSGAATNPAVSQGSAAGGSSGVITPPDTAQAPVDTTSSSDAVTTPEIPQGSAASGSSNIITAPDTAQAPVDTTVTTPEVPLVPAVTQSPIVTISPTTTQTTLVNPLSIVALKSHNPLQCWLRVYLDLWILFVVWFNPLLTGYLEDLNLVSISDRVVQNDPDRSSGTSSSSNESGDIVNNPPTDHSEETSINQGQLKQELPNVWITVLAFCFHLLFYVLIIVCVSNYGAVLHERSIWLSANEMTRQYLHKFYRVPFKQEYGAFHELFGPIRFIDIFRFHLHSWIMISRSLPG